MIMMNSNEKNYFSPDNYLKFYLENKKILFKPLLIDYRKDEGIQCNLYEEETNIKTISQSSLGTNGFLQSNDNIFIYLRESKSEKSTKYEERKNDLLNLLGKKRKELIEQDNKNSLMNIKIKKDRQLKMGKEKFVCLKKHSKYSEYNMIQKIKTNIFKSIRYWLNNSFPKLSVSSIDPEIKVNQLEKPFLKINHKEVIKNITKDYNLSMMDKKISEIFSNNINDKYTLKTKSYNANLIKKILSDNIYVDVISILNLTFREVFNIFIGNINEDIKNKISVETLNKFEKLDYFIDKLQREDINKNTHENDKRLNKIYLDNIKNLCLSYENWFVKKTKRNRKHLIK